MIDIASKQIIPAVIKYTRSPCGYDQFRDGGRRSGPGAGRALSETSALLGETKDALKKLTQVTAEASSMAEGETQARYYHDTVMPAMSDLRAPVDKLEMIVDKDMWPMPSYGDLIFEV